ncbi:hypothetical protein RB600_006998 [Gaeumannomyces tritici]
MARSTSSFDSTHKGLGPRRATTEYSPVRDIQASETVQWGVYWGSPALMAFLLIAGVAFALGHHFHYKSLNNTLVPSQESQQWAIRIGTGLAFLSKASLAASVGVAYTQRLWVSVKKRSMSLQNLDKAFSLTTDPFSFLSAFLIARTKMLYLLAAAVWCIPLVATITPATLSIRPGIVSRTASVNVPRPDFDNSKPWANFEGVGRPQSPSAVLNRLVAATASSVSVLPFPAPFPNASYTLDFFAPAIKCETLAESVAANASLQGLWDEHISFASKFYTLLVSNTTKRKLTNHLFINMGGPSGANYSCHLYNASYTVDFAFRNGVQTSSTVRNLAYPSPNLPLLEIKRGQIFSDYKPGEVAYAYLFDALVDRFLVANMYLGASGTLNGGSDTSFFLTGISSCPDLANGTSAGKELGLQKYAAGAWACGAGSVPRAVEELSRNVSLSLMSSEFFSSSSSSSSGVRVDETANYYAYDEAGLLRAYGVAVAAALTCVCVGAHAYVANGYSASSSFSSVLLTTRNADLDRLAVGQCLGSQRAPAELRRTVLRFGVVRLPGGSAAGGGEHGVAHATFGLRGTVEPLVKGQACL